MSDAFCKKRKLNKLIPDKDMNLEFSLIQESNSEKTYESDSEKPNLDEPVVEILGLPSDQSFFKQENDVSLCLSTYEEYFNSYEELSKADPHCSRWTIPHHFAVNTYEEFEEILKNYEHDTFSWFIKAMKYKSKFLQQKQNSVHDEFCAESSFSGKKIRFQEPLGSPLFCGMAYEIVAVMRYSCHFSKDTGIYKHRLDSKFYCNKNLWSLCELMKYATDTYSAVCPSMKLKKVHQTKKLNCPVSFLVKKMLVFPDFVIDLKFINDRSERSRITKSIRNEKKSNVKTIEKIVFTLPSTLQHNHILNLQACEKEPTDRRILQKVEDLVLSGITDTMMMKEKISHYIREDLKIDDCQLKRGRYNPSTKCITNKIYAFCRKNGLKMNENRSQQVVGFSPKIELSEEPSSVHFERENFSLVPEEEELDDRDIMTLSVSSDNFMSNFVDGNDSNLDYTSKFNLPDQISHQLMLLDEFSREIDDDNLSQFLQDVTIVRTKWENYINTKLKLFQSLSKTND